MIDIFRLCAAVATAMSANYDMKNTTTYTDRTLAEALPSGIVVLDHQCRVQWWNKKAKQLLDLKKQHCAKSFSRIIQQPNFIDLVENLEHPSLEINAPMQKNKRISLTVGRYLNQYYLVCIEDVTQLYLLEKIRQDFVANVSHELRTPLTVINGYLEILVEQKDISPQDAEMIFEQMYDQSQRMEKLVSDLLLLSRLESGGAVNSSNQCVNVITLVEKICEQARILSGSRKHQIHFVAPSKKHLLGQIDELQSVFANIIFNAVSYTPRGGTIEVVWDVDEKGASLSVTDTGIGVEPDHIPRLTERFYRVDKARSRKNGGTGLGLAIVKHALLRHNAHLEIKSELGKGSRFICRFKLNQIID